MRESGSSIVEVVIMMLIISMSIIGIYSMVNNGQRLAILTDDRLTAINMAKEWLESIGALRDTFALRSFSASNCFFTIDGTNYGNCPLVAPVTNYVLSDTKTLVGKISTGDFSVCMNEHGWYSQEKINDTTPCTQNVSVICGGENTSNCKTRFTRNITFKNCSNPRDVNQCIVAVVRVIWWTDSDKSITLEQIFTRIR